MLDRFLNIPLTGPNYFQHLTGKCSEKQSDKISPKVIQFLRTSTNGSSHQRFSIKKVFLKVSQNSQGIPVPESLS